MLDTETVSRRRHPRQDRNCQTKAKRPIGTVTRKVPRHPINAPRKLPTGAAITSANAVPPWSRAMALGRSGPDARRARMAVDRDQKPPMAIPTRARPIRKTREVGCEGNGQTRERPGLPYRPGRPFSVELGQKGVAEQAGEHGEEPRHGDRLSRLAFRDGQILGDWGQEAHRHELQSDQEKGQE